MNGSTKKITVELTERESSHLARVARLEGRSERAVVRDAILAYAGRDRRPIRSFAIDGVGEGPGDSVADIPDDETQLRGFGE